MLLLSAFFFWGRGASQLRAVKGKVGESALELGVVVVVYFLFSGAGGRVSFLPFGLPNVSGSVLCQEVCSVRKGFCQEGILSGRNFVRQEFCQEGILSGRDFVRKGFCQGGILSGRDFVRKDFVRKGFCQEGILSGRDFVRQGFCQAGILSGRDFARKRALPGSGLCQEAGSARKESQLWSWVLSSSAGNGGESASGL